MAKISFNPVEIAFKSLNDKPAIELYGRSGDKQVCVLVDDFEPYFWTTDKKHVKDDRIVRIEEHKKKFLGKNIEARKIVVKQPSDVPLLREKFKALEADIPYVRRFLIDRKITPLLTYEAEGEFIESKHKVGLFAAKKIKNESDDVPELKTLAVDIETHTQMGKEILPEKDPIIMIAVYGRRMKKVLTWKHFKAKHDYIEYLGSEVEMLERFRQIIEDFKPDILTGYFSDGFDLPYIKARADKYKIDLGLGLDGTGIRMKKGKTPVAEITGIAHIDAFKFVKRIFRTSFTSFKLNDVAKELLGEKKVTVNMDDLYKSWNEQNGDLEKFAEYNLQDAKLVYDLCEKLMPNVIEFTKMIGLTPTDVSRMSFSQLVEWYLIKEAPEFNELVPNRPDFKDERSRRTESYEGAYVYEPTPGLYRDIAVFDFMSLYPTIISSHNISPDTIITGKGSDDGVLKGISFDERRRGFIATVIDNVIKRRLRLKKLAKESPDDRLLEARQQALKTIANSIYGYYGFFGARWYNIECAKAITAYGRYHILDVINKAKKAGLHVLYSDSVPYDRRLLVQFENGDVKPIKIGELYDKYRNVRVSTLSFDKQGQVVFKPIRKVIRHPYKGKLLSINTRYGSTTVTPAHSVYLFDPQKNSIFLANAKYLKKGDNLVSLTNPQFVETYRENFSFDLLDFDFGKYGSELLLYSDKLMFPQRYRKCPYCKKKRLLSTHVSLRHPERREDLRKQSPFKWIGGKNAKTRKIPRYWTLDNSLAWLLGFYCAEGSVSNVQTKSGKKALVSFGGQNRTLIKRVKVILDKKTTTATRIIENYDHRIGKRMFYYRVQCLPIVALFEEGFEAGKGSENKKVPWFILTASEEIRKAFLKGYIEGDGNTVKDKRYTTHFLRASTKSKDLAIGLDFLFKSISHGNTSRNKEIKHVAWQYRNDKPKMQTLRVQSAKDSRENFCGAEIRTIKKVWAGNYVYDVEVKDNHNFVDAEGMLLVHNTDSVFIALNGKRKSEVLDFVEKINADLPGIMGLEYEDLFKSGIFVATKGSESGAKKKYALMREDGKMKIRGFETVRRNLSLVAKETQEKVLQMILSGEKKETVIEVVKKVVKDLRQKKTPTEKIIIKTQISRDVKSYENVPPHVAVAIKMQKRGEKVGAGTQVTYVVTEGKGPIRDRARLPDEAKEGEYDAEYYISHQVIPAVERIMEVIGCTPEELSEQHQQSKLGSYFG